MDGRPGPASPEGLELGCRVAVVGNGGGGKSTIARAVAAARGLPLLEVDDVQWGPDWQRVPEESVARVLEQAQAGARWVIDGFGPWPLIERRLERADTIVLVDMPLWAHCWWAAERLIASHAGTARPFGDRPPQPARRLFEAIGRVHEEIRPRLVAAVAAQRQRAAVHVLESPEAVEAFCRRLGRPDGGS